MPSDTGKTPAARVEPLLDLIRAEAPASSQERRPSAKVVRALADEGLLKLLTPRAYGGAEATALEFLELVETIAVVDGSTAWTAMTLNEEIELAAAYLPPATMTELCRRVEPPVVAGSGLVSGRAVAAGDGWRITGRWSFVTGSPVADHLLLGAIVERSDPRMLCYVVVPAGRVAVLDTWDTVGMRGTGSHDVEMADVFVPGGWAGLTDDPDRTVPDTTLFRLPAGLRFPFPKVGVAAGLARGAIDEFVRLAEAKSGRVSRRSLREHADVQLAVAEAEADLRSGRAFAVEMLTEVWALAEGGRPIPSDLHALTRLACTASVAASVRAVETVASLAGTTANRSGGPFATRLADVRAVPQHFMVGGQHRLQAGRVLLGLQPDDPLF